MRTKSTKLKRSWKIVVRAGDRWFTYRNDDIPNTFKNKYDWAEVVLNQFKSAWSNIAATDWRIVRVINRREDNARSTL